MSPFCSQLFSIFVFYFIFFPHHCITNHGRFSFCVLLSLHFPFLFLLQIFLPLVMGVHK